jgi:acetyl-CoA carboxylase biotin carboxyl carrier protein
MPELLELLQVVSEQAAGLAGQNNPGTVRVRVGEVVVELSWPDPPAVQRTAPPAGAAEPPADNGSSGISHITSDSVGVFYQAPSPGAPPYVEPGSMVSSGQQVGIVEAMKLMLPVIAKEDCEILEALVSDGSTVEFGQPLFAVETVGAGRGGGDV